MITIFFGSENKTIVLDRTQFGTHGFVPIPYFYSETNDKKIDPSNEHYFGLKQRISIEEHKHLIWLCVKA